MSFLQQWKQTSGTAYWLLFPLVAMTAPASLASGMSKTMHRHAWKLFCFIVLPAIYLGLLGEFSIGGRTVVPPSLILVGGSMLLFSGFAAMHFRRLLKFPLVLPVTWYLLAVSLSGWHSVSHLHWTRGLIEVLLGFCFLLFPHLFLRNRRQLELCLNVLVLLAISTVLFAILQTVAFASIRGALALVYRKEDLWWIVGWGWRGRLAGNWVHPSYLGSVLNVAAPFALLRYVRADTAPKLGIALIWYLTLAAGIALTGTRTPTLAFFLASAVFIGLVKNRRRAWTALACAAAVVISLSLFHFRFAPPDVGSTASLPETMALMDRLELRGSRKLATVNMRWITDREALSLFRTSPWFGIGMRNYPDRALGDPMAQFSIHNSVVQNLTELGVFGLAAFLALVGAALRTDFRPRLVSVPELQPLRAALFCSSCAILLESLAENSLAVWQVLALFWLMRGISLVISQHPTAFLNCGVSAGRAKRQYRTRSSSQEGSFASFPIAAG